MSRPTIALCMIVRDEARVLERCLTSVHDEIDSWVICDTGSTDGSQDEIFRVLGDIPGTLHETEWVDFGHNRSELMRNAHGAADYLLLLDADMSLSRDAPLPDLDADAYLLRERGDLDFGIPRLVRGDRRWWFEGSTHEYLAADGPIDQRELDALSIVHHADGSSRWEKLVRDLALLKRDLARDPSRPRAVFYLAQTYRDLGKRDLAIAAYRRRVEMGGWEEEVFYANLQEGILRAQEDPDSAVATLLEAWDRRPSRAEPLYELARLYRGQGRFALAHLFAERGLAITYPKDVLFVHRWAYTWGLRFERGLAAAGLGRLDEAQDDLDALVDLDDVPREIAEFARERSEGVAHRRNPHHMGSSTIAHLEWLAPSAQIGEIKLSVQPAWPCFNPSIAADGDGFRMVVRTANYQIERGVLHDDGQLVNLNYLATLDANLSLQAVEPIVDVSTGPERFPSQINGYEDCRLFAVDGRWWMTATVCDCNPVERREIALLELDGSAITRVMPLAGPEPGRHEKNWMPVVLDGVAHVVYTVGPTVVLRCDLDDGQITEAARNPAPPFARALRGGSQGVRVDGGYLHAVHEVDRTEDALRYLHRFVLLDEALTLVAASERFSFSGDRVEFCAGMARHEDRLVLSFGVGDAAAGLALVALDDVLGMLDVV